MNTIFPPSQVVALPIHQSEQTFPVRRVYCVGRNYADHAREMGSDPDREPPFSFVKPVTASRLLRFDPIALPNCLIRLKRKRYIMK